MTPERQKWWDSLPEREKMLREQIEKTKIEISHSKFALQVCLTDEDIKWFISRIKKKKVVLTALKHELDNATVATYTGRYEGSLANFRRGAMLNGRGNNYAAMYEEAKAYAAKHIAHVYAHDIDGVKVDESLKDIAIYSLIELYMLKEWEKGRTQNVCGEGNCNEDVEK